MALASGEVEMAVPMARFVSTAGVVPAAPGLKAPVCQVGKHPEGRWLRQASGGLFTDGTELADLLIETGAQHQTVVALAS
jgi:hypothetical protein